MEIFPQARIRNARLGRTLIPQRRVLNMLCEYDYNEIDEKCRLYISDTKEEISHLLDTLDYSSDILSNCSQNYTTQLEVEIAKRSNEMNRLASQFSSIATIVLPLTLLAGMWGMNVPVPGGDSQSLQPFFTICVGFACLSLSLSLSLSHISPSCLISLFIIRG